MNLRSAKLNVALLSTLVLTGSLLEQARAGAQVKDFAVTDDDQTATFECTGNSVIVSGDDNHITVKGDCTKLTVSGDDNVIDAVAVREVEVSGDDNTISVQTVAKITALGDDNTVKWGNGVAGRPPEISSQGDDNTIRQTSN